MLTKSGAKLLDFGLAKVAAQASAAGSSSAEVATMTKALTVEGTIMGTFQYMAPEQLEGEEADVRTDIFALGIVLYEMVTGRKAFQGKSQATLISAIMSSDPQPVTAIQPSASPALERVIQRCLAKDPDERWQTARDLCRELEWIALGGSQTGVPAPVAKRRTARVPWIIAAAGLLTAAVALWLYLTRPVSETPLIRVKVALPSRIPELAGPAISPDGKLAAAWLGTASDWQVYIYSLASGELRVLPNTNQMAYARWSPDSRYLAGSVAGSGLRKVEVASGAASTLAPYANVNAIAWGKDGVILFSGPGGLYRVRAAGGSAERVLTLPSTESPQLLDFLPDGDHFLMSVVANGRLETRVLSLGGGAAKVVESNGMGHFASPGYLLLQRGNTLQAQPFDLKKMALSGAPVTIATNLSPNSLQRFSASANGIVTFHQEGAGSGQQITWCDRSGKILGTVGAPNEYTNPALSPDGRRVAVGVGSFALKQRDIWVYDLVRGGGYRLTFDPADDFNPVWSPDGRYIAFGSDRRGRRDIYRKLASGTGDEELIYATTTEDKSPESWAPDGGSLWLTVSDPKNGADIYHLSLADRQAVKYISTPFAEDKAQLSPDGRWLAYRSHESSRDEVYIQPYPATGERSQVSTDGGTEPQWRGDGRELFYLAGDVLMSVDLKPAAKGLEISVPHRLFEMRISPSQTRNRYVVAKDGQKFLVLWQQEAEQGQASFDAIVNWPELLKGQ